MIDNDYKFTVSQSAQDNMDAAVSDGNNIIEFLSSEGYIRFKADYEVSSKDLYAVYKLWCDDNALSSLSQKSFCSFLKQNESRYNIEYTNKVNIGGGEVCQRICRHRASAKTISVKMILTRKYVYHPYQVYHGTASTLGTRTFQSVSLLFFNAVGGCPVFGH